MVFCRLDMGIRMPTLVIRDFGISVFRLVVFWRGQPDEEAWGRCASHRVAQTASGPLGDVRASCDRVEPVLVRIDGA